MACCHAIHHGDCALTAKAQGRCTLWDLELRSDMLGQQQTATPAMLASSGLLTLPIKHNRHHTLVGKDFFPGISSLFALLEPEEAALIPPHPACSCQTCASGGVRN